MRDLREEYKAVVLQACRIAVKGGGMSNAYEEFIIENIDRLVDDLSDDDFAYLIMNGKVPVRYVGSEQEYDRIFESQKKAVELLEHNNLTEYERVKTETYNSILEALRCEYKAREWDF
ncbi:hypothetical protein [Paenibacillus naphthalenovorans]|uniref:hypothetical protein n=1 Tax=Paenibacillus naphthalenovorans TaxID=162209 RepID=UPI0008900E9C|nr:hypothetical protein [Paenibacillus naphthalenovorans]SDJ76930.1 hypothetical protein SAMN05421868_14340 [Paenibacillus naphthalenovorans]